MDNMNPLPVIVGGFYRSGTSLVRRLLDAHSRIHCPPEIKFFKDLRGDYRDDPLGHVRLFATLPSMGLDHNEIGDIFGRAFVEAHALAARKAGKARWADKNPENVLYLEQWRQLLPSGFTFVHVVRHPLDALASLVEIGFSKAVPADFAGKVMLLKTFVDAGLQYERAYPEASYRVCYERLVSDPGSILMGLFDRLGENFELQVLDRFNHPERGCGIEDPKVAGTARVHAQSLGRWHNDLTLQQVATARAILGARFLDYEIGKIGN